MTVSLEVPISTQVESFIGNHLKLTPAEFVLIAYTSECRAYAAAFRLALAMRGHETVAARMVAQKDPDLADRLKAILPATLASDRGMVVITLEAENMSHFPVFIDIIARYGEHRVRTFRLTSVGPRLFNEGLRMTGDEMSRRNGTLLAELLQDSSVSVKSDLGTDLEIVFDHDRYEWMSIRGVVAPGRITILPAGEIATFPASINGIFVADGAIHPNIMMEFDSRLEDCPMTVNIENSNAVSASCDNQLIARLTERLFLEPFGRRVGEVGFGTNATLTGFTEQNSHLNERFPGLHLGFGNHNQNPSVAGDLSDTHYDIIMPGGYVVDRSSGREDIDIANFATDASVVHPYCNRDEDMDDCCSVL